jgi:putative DNA primase/helicase
MVMTHETIRDRFEAATLAADRFVSVKDGQKMCIDHDTRYSDPTNVPGCNYGIYADEDDALFVLDVDDHENESLNKESTIAVAALSGLPSTLETESPHVETEGAGGHRIYKLAGEKTPAELFKERFGAKNPVASWGEVIAKNKYVVGAGSQLDSCDKDSHDCSEKGEGHYEISHDDEIAEVEPEELASALSTDPDLEDVELVDDGTDNSSPSENPNNDTNQSNSGTAATREYDREEIEEMLSHLPGDQHFDDWIRTGYAVYDWNDGDIGQEVFEEWSKDNRKWEKEESQRQIDYIWNNGEQASDDPDDHNASVGTLVYLAKENGWEPPSPSPPEPPEPPEPDNRESDTETDSTVSWANVRWYYEQEGKKAGRKEAAEALEKQTNWMYVIDSETLWVYDDGKGYFSPWGEQTAHRVLERSLETHYSQREANEVIGRLEARNQTRRKELNARTRDSPLLCVANGVVNLSNGELEEHSPEYKFTRGLQWDYDPARANPEPVKEFLDDVTKREADRDTLLDHLAHGLMPGHPYRAFLIMYGPGSNGKTRVGKLLRGFVGEENAASVELQDLTGDDSFATGGLPGAFVNVGDDISVSEIRDTSILKSLTGDGTVRANEKYEKQYEFENEAAMFFSANEPPRIREQTDAISDRLYPIEMPYRFVDDPEPDNENEKEKIPGIAEGLLNDDAAMRGLLLLAVKHAQDVRERNGQYSMPESPQERRELYESASDPIKRFALTHMEPASGSEIVLKDDAYTVYQQMCDTENARPAGKDVFKQQVGGIASIDLESTRTRKLTAGDGRESGWKYVKFSDSAKELMPNRLLERYFESETEPDSEETENRQPVAYNATPLTDAAETLTGYVTVTAEVVKVETYGENTTKAILKDESGAMDFVTWDSTLATHIEGLQGETVVIEDAEVGEHDGTRQLQPVEGLTEISSIQEGVGHTEGPTPEKNRQLADAATDGGELEGSTAKVEQHLRTNCESSETVTVAQIAGEIEDLSPDSAESALERIQSSKRLLEPTDDGWRIL